MKLKEDCVKIDNLEEDLSNSMLDSIFGKALG
jgi:hypothetical protein